MWYGATWWNVEHTHTRTHYLIWSLTHIFFADVKFTTCVDRIRSMNFDKRKLISQLKRNSICLQISYMLVVVEPSVGIFRRNGMTSQSHSGKTANSFAAGKQCATTNTQNNMKTAFELLKEDPLAYTVSFSLLFMDDSPRVQ